MQIRSLFLVRMTALAVMAASLGGWMMTLAVADFRPAGRVQRAMDVNTSPFAAADRFAKARALIGTALPADDPADAIVRSALERRRQVDEMIVRPRTQRAPGLIAHPIAVMNGLFDALDGAVDFGDVAASRRDGSYGPQALA